MLFRSGGREGEGREGKGREGKEKMAGNFPNLGKKTHIQVQEDQKVPNKLNPKRSTPRHIIIKTSKFKERILKTAREKQITTYKETP